MHTRSQSMTMSSYYSRFDSTPLLDEEFDVDAYLAQPEQMIESQSHYPHFTGETND